MPEGGGMRVRVGRWACAVGVILDQRGGVDICGLVGLLKMRVSEIFDGQNRNVGPRGGGRSRTPPTHFGWRGEEGGVPPPVFREAIYYKILRVWVWGSTRKTRRTGPDRTPWSGGSGGVA